VGEGVGEGVFEFVFEGGGRGRGRGRGRARARARQAAVKPSPTTIGPPTRKTKPFFCSTGYARCSRALPVWVGPPA